MRGPLEREVRQSLWLLALTGAWLAACAALGALVIRASG